MDHKKRIQTDNKYWNVVAELKKERQTSKNLADALEGLLNDTQHAEHDCGDARCPVAYAKETLLKYCREEYAPDGDDNPTSNAVITDDNPDKAP